MKTINFALIVQGPKYVNSLTQFTAPHLETGHPSLFLFFAESVSSNISAPAQESFITPLSTNPEASTSLQYYQQLPSLKTLATFIQRAVCDQHRSEATECRSHAESLLNADAVDIDYDSISHTLILTGLWASVPTGGWTEEIHKPVSSADQVEFGLLGAEPGISPEETQVGGLLAVVGTDKKLSTCNTMIQVTSRREVATRTSNLTRYSTDHVLIPVAASLSLGVC